MWNKLYLLVNLPPERVRSLAVWGAPTNGRASDDDDDVPTFNYKSARNKISKPLPLNSHFWHFCLPNTPITADLLIMTQSAPYFRGHRSSVSHTHTYTNTARCDLNYTVQSPWNHSILILALNSHYNLGLLRLSVPATNTNARTPPSLIRGVAPQNTHTRARESLQPTRIDDVRVCAYKWNATK